MNNFINAVFWGIVLGCLFGIAASGVRIATALETHNAIDYLQITCKQ